MRKAPRFAAPAAAALLATGAVVAAAAGASPVQAAGVGVPEVFTGFKDSMPLGPGGVAVTSLSVPIGTYSITAKATAINNGTSATDVKCKLSFPSPEPRFDLAEASLPTSARRQTMSLAVTKIANSPTLIFLTCSATPAGNVTVTFAKITATRVADPNHLHEVQMP